MTKQNHTVKSCGKAHACCSICRPEVGAVRRGKQNHLRHGHTCHDTWTPTYTTWCGMLRRCRDLNDKSYGGRDIRVCERWLVFENFLADMGARPEGTTIDRINNDGNYEPGNCHWATPKEQAANRRSKSMRCNKRLGPTSSPVDNPGTVDQTMTTSPRLAVGARGWPISGTITFLGEEVG